MSPLYRPTRSVRQSIVLAVVLASATACHHRSPTPHSASATDSVPGYGTQSREQIGGAVRTLTLAELATVNVKRVEELLAGRVAGVRVVPTPDGGFTIRIRGVGTFRGDTEPLYVVDGMVVQVEPGEGLNWLDPNEIARIDVLKDPAETSMYGVRGANGVILIKTKRGSP